MSELYGTPGAPRQVVNRLHDAPTFTVEVETPVGTLREEVCCAMCGAKPDGHSSDGTPIYSGGFVYAEITKPGEYFHGAKQELTAACRCAFGKAFHDRAKVAYFDELPPMAEIADPFPLLVYRKQHDCDYMLLTPPARDVISDDYVRASYFPHNPPMFRPGETYADYNERAEARREADDDA